MIISSLVKRYADTCEVPLGWQQREASYTLVLSEDGELLDVVPFVEEGKLKKRAFILPSTGSGRSGKNGHETAYFLCDDGNYMLGLDRRKFETARMLHVRLLEDVSTVAARAIRSYFSKIPTLPQNIDAKDAATAKYVFQVNGRRVDYKDGDAEIRAAWDGAQSYEGERIRCLVTGKPDTIMRLHSKAELRGLSMGGAPLIAMNDQTSFRSYGTKPGDPPTLIGQQAAFAYVTALNELLKNVKNRQFIGGDTLVYWAEDGEGAEEDMFSWFSQPTEDDADKLDALMKMATKGTVVPKDVKFDSRFHLLCLSPGSQRIIVRFFHVDSFGVILNNNIEHYHRMEIAKYGNDRHRYLYPWMILNETTVSKKSSDVTPLLGGQFIYSIITGGRYPMTLYQAILKRIRAHEDVNKCKAAIIKAILMRNYDEREVTTVALNSQTCNKPYVLGRLFSALEQLQQRASDGGLNTTIRDRYFSSACANPASVFPTILKLSNHHAAKLDNAVFYEKLKTELLSKLDFENPFSSSLNLDDQGRFILGYYHQTQDFFTPKKEKEEQTNV